MTAAPSAKAVLQGDRRALAKAITLLESKRAEDAAAAESLLLDLYPHAGKSIRIGISGIPGVGKSSLIEVLGLEFIAAGHRVAVLAIDPSSSETGGSILGDKTRMQKLGANPQAYIRPSPAGGQLGGVARRTRDSLVAVEAAGYDVVLIETVGVGQSESQAHAMVDVFVVLVMPNTGDDLQAVKKGILEQADVLVIAKADADNLAAAERARIDYSGVKSSAHSEVSVPIVLVSSVTGQGITALKDTINIEVEKRRASGQFTSRRLSQTHLWVEEELRDSILPHLLSFSKFQLAYGAAMQKVDAGNILPRVAVRSLLESTIKLEE